MLIVFHEIEEEIKNCNNLCQLDTAPKARVVDAKDHQLKKLDLIGMKYRSSSPSSSSIHSSPKGKCGSRSTL